MANFIEPKMIRILNSFSVETVKIPNKNYEMGMYPITIAEYMHFVQETDSHYPEWIENDSKYKDINLTDNAPIIGVSWYDAIAYCKWLSEKTGKRYRLPYDRNEWLYSAGINKIEDIEEYGKYAWYKDNSQNTTHIVGEKLPNELNLYDMYGNVWEWIDEDFENLARDEQSPGFDDITICGGGWNSNMTDSYILGHHPYFKENYIGFRILLEYENERKN